jgi:hypothetical protein
MPSAASQPRVVRENVEVTVSRLRTFIGRMEHRYEMDSAEMQRGVDSGTVRETAEISRWLSALSFLHELDARGRTTGTHTSSTR